jgi:hypothetical protein
LVEWKLKKEPLIMCGATSAQEDLQAKQAAFYDQATKHAEETFGEQQSLLAKLRETYDPIIAKGPNQEGFSDAERNDLNAGAIDRTANNYSAAAKAVGENIAARGGGNMTMPTGAEDQMRAEIAASSAGELSRLGFPAPPRVPAAKRRKLRMKSRRQTTAG